MFLGATKSSPYGFFPCPAFAWCGSLFYLRIRSTMGFHVTKKFAKSSGVTERRWVHSAPEERVPPNHESFAGGFAEERPFEEEPAAAAEVETGTGADDVLG